MKSWITSAKWLLLVSGILIVILGATMFFNRYPWENLLTLALFVGFMMLFSGISELVSFISGRKGHRSVWMLMGGLLSTILGAWTVFGYGDEKLAPVLPIIFAVWVMTSGVMRAVGSFTLKSEGSKMWWGILILGVVEVFLGFVLLFHPILAALIVSYTIALMLTFYGMSNIMLFFNIQRSGPENPKV